MCFWSFKIWVHVFLFVTYTKCSTHLFVISCPAVAGEADTARGVHDFMSLINIAVAIILAFRAFRGHLNASSATRGYLLNKKVETKLDLIASMKNQRGNYFTYCVHISHSI
jgi:hypothetical protein